ncbi:MAG: DUF2019 domain-containing protein [Alphaproteobacteria bacterium]
MSTSNLSNFDDTELIAAFASAAREMGETVLDSDNNRTNQLFRYMEQIDRILRQRGRQSRLLLAPLLDYQNRFVRYYAAQYLLGLVPDRARAVIEWNAKYGFDAIAGDAGMTLDNLDSGFYKPD